MEAQSPLQTLPRREYGMKVNFSKGQQKIVVTNFFQIKFNSKYDVIYQFMFDTEPQIPQDSKDLLYRLVKSIRKELKQKLDLITASGLMIWGSKNLNIPLSIKTAFKYQEKEFKFDVIIKPTKVLDVETLFKSKDGIAMVHQMYNNKIKDVLKDRNMDEVTRGKYFNKKEQVRVEGFGLNILRGYKMTLSNLKQKSMSLQIDVCSKVFQANNLLEQINRLSRDGFDGLIGQTVITRYGKIKTYRIQKIDTSKTPMSKFHHELKAGHYTFVQYYQQAYGLKITQMNQPLVEVVSRFEKKINSKGQIEKIPMPPIYLIPQFISLTGMKDEQRNDYKAMNEVAKTTKLTPDQRLQLTAKLTQQINGDVFEVKQPKRAIGYQLNDPQVKLDGKTVFKAKDGGLNFRDKVKQTIDFKDWVVAYSQGKNPKYDDEEADSFVNLIQDAAVDYKMKFSNPGFVTCDSNIQSFKTQIQKDIAKNGKPQIIVLLLNSYEQKLYPKLKQFITCELKIPSQMIKKKTVGSKAKNAMSAASKIIIQMNQKVGGVAWEVKKDRYFDERKCMHGAFSISKGVKGFTLAFVGTLNNQNTKIFNQCKIGYPRKQDIPPADFNSIFMNWAKNYVGQNHEGPNVIMVYREGLSIPQVKVQVEQEYAALKNVIAKIASKTGKPNYKPEIMYIIVNTKINTRIFDTHEGTASQGKFWPKVHNPASGTCVLDELSTDNHFDFHLTAQKKVTQGTCTPTHYIVVRNESNIPQENLAQFTYEQCFNYPNWQGAVKVPAVLQCANKLSKLVGESIQANVLEGDVTKGFYFL